jgi:hypothetical protein
MENEEAKKLQMTLKEHKEAIAKLKQESTVLKKAIWDMLNYANMYVLLLDDRMIVRLINWSLAKDLGFDNEKQAVGRCWIDFIPDEIKDLIKAAHHSLAFEPKKGKYREFVNDIQLADNKIVTVKWFNVPINSQYHMTFSMGLKVAPIEATVVSEDSIRTYYRDIIEKDRTMIQSLRDVVIKGFHQNQKTCTLEEY